MFFIGIDLQKDKYFLTDNMSEDAFNIKYPDAAIVFSSDRHLDVSRKYNNLMKDFFKAHLFSLFEKVESTNCLYIEFINLFKDELSIKLINLSISCNFKKSDGNFLHPVFNLSSQMLNTLTPKSNFINKQKDLSLDQLNQLIISLFDDVTNFTNYELNIYTRYYDLWTHQINLPVNKQIDFEVLYYLHTILDSNLEKA